METKYYWCKSCGEYMYRVIGKQHGDGQVDSDENPVYLLCDSRDIPSDEEITDITSCGCNR